METDKEVTRPAFSIDKDEEDAITCSDNSGDRMLEKQKPKSVVWSLFGYKLNFNGKPTDESLFVRFVVPR